MEVLPGSGKRWRFPISLMMRWAGWVPLMALASAWAGLPLPPASRSQPELKKPGNLPESCATWNLQWFPGNRPESSEAGRKWHEQGVVRIIRKLGVDLLLVQEVVDRAVLERVAKDYPWKVISNFQRAGDENADLPVQNLAILSKSPIQDAWEVGFHNLPLTPDRPVRGFLGVRLGNKKTGMTVYTVHLKSNRGGREASTLRRERAMEYLRRDWEKRGLDPKKDRILVAGDFNCSLWNPEFADERTIRGLLKEGWFLPTGGIPWPGVATVKPDPGGQFPATDFDHLLLSPGWKEGRGKLRGFGKVETMEAGVMQGPDVPSDHYPVWVRF